MAVIDQQIGERFALYHGDCIEVMDQFPPGKVHLSVYSPPFGGLYHYSSSERDLSNCKDYSEFFAHYTYVVRALHRITMPGRITAVHCMDVPSGNAVLNGIPVSTTHLISASTMGVGATMRFSAVRWGIAGNIVAAWILTFPICGALGYLFSWLLHFIF